MSVQSPTGIFIARSLMALYLVSAFSACAAEPGDPDPESAAYQKAVSDFYLSLAAGQTDEALFAFNKMHEVSRAYPDEPAAWANLGVYAMRQGNYDLAADRLATARSLAPDNPDILLLSAILGSRLGNIEQSIDYLRNARSSDPADLRVAYMLVTELERQDDVANAGEIMDLLAEMRDRSPENLAILYESSRFAAKVQDGDVLVRRLEELSGFADAWPPEAVERLRFVERAAQAGAFAEASTGLAFLRHELEQLLQFREDLAQVQPDPTEVGFLIPRFLWLPQPENRAAPPDFGMTFSRETAEWMPARAAFVKGVTLFEDLPPRAIFGAEGLIQIDDDLSLPFPGEIEDQLLPPHAIAEIDYNLDFRNDLAMAGSGGFRLYRQEAGNTFTDVTAETNLPSNVVNRSYRGVWVADVDLDGDLDLVLAPTDGEPVVLRNNSDGTFTPLIPFQGVRDVVHFIWVDLRDDGASDAIFLDRSGGLHVFENHRNGEFEKRDDLPIATGVAAFTAADINADSRFNLIVVTDDFRILRLDYEPARGGWTSETIAEGTVTTARLTSEATRVFAHDFDNNGRLDILVSSPDESRLWLGDDRNVLEPLDAVLPGGVYSVFDINGNERLDLLGLTADGEPYQLINSGSMNYHGRSIRARASGTEGDGRINSFGIGGQMEVRSGLLYQKRLIASPIVHFGLGTYEDTEMLRIIWPNGSVQTQFAELGIGATVFNEQILKGSCPWLFASDGEEMHFVTDILWRSPLGLRINAQETAGIIQTLDRVKIPGSMLKPVNGVYDLRITAELWETHFFDYVELVAVDHPVGTEIFVDERFVFPPPDLSTRLVRTPQPVARVLDDRGNDVRSIVQRPDGNYLRAFEKTMYQGVVEDHFIEVHLPESAPAGGPLWLVASGWLRPTDSSLNLAISQGENPGPTGLKIEVSDGEGGWRVLHDDYGIPAGKTKTILLDLEGAFADRSDRRLRLHTTSEIYWDAIRWAEGLPADQMKERSLQPTTMELRYRGYSEWNRADDVSPKLPRYGVISGTHPRWRDLVGFHTRFGDVSELLSEIDDRYVIMNAGDEIVLRFAAPDEPEEGWTRSYVFVSDGWVKDGDYNTEASKTVLPLPYHGQRDYEYAARMDLRDDPVYQRHRQDWIDYHTRYVTPREFRSALVFD